MKMSGDGAKSRIEKWPERVESSGEVFRNRSGPIIPPFLDKNDLKSLNIGLKFNFFSPARQIGRKN